MTSVALASADGISIHGSDEVLHRYPNLRLGMVRAQGLKAAATRLDSDTILAAVASEVRTAFEGPDAIVADEIIAGWRAAMKASGLKPAAHRSSVEQLLRRMQSGSFSSTGLPIVDLYCAVSARHRAPLGAYDAARVDGRPISLRLSLPTDRFHPLSGDQQDVASNVPVYAIDSEVICWGFNVRDSLTTALSERTDDAIFVGEAVTAPQVACLRNALTDLAEHLRSAGADVMGSTIP